MTYVPSLKYEVSPLAKVAVSRHSDYHCSVPRRPGDRDMLMGEIKLLVEAEHPLKPLSHTGDRSPCSPERVVIGEDMFEAAVQCPASARVLVVAMFRYEWWKWSWIEIVFVGEIIGGRPAVMG
jgi:hypothetical protein